MFSTVVQGCLDQNQTMRLATRLSNKLDCFGRTLGPADGEAFIAEARAAVEGLGDAYGPGSLHRLSRCYGAGFSIRRQFSRAGRSGLPFSLAKAQSFGPPSTFAVGSGQEAQTHPG
jgi:hypothetical protein